jgi:hypothetical protein
MKWLIRLYPRAWRDRYAAELSDLIDDLDAGPAVAVDLLRGAAVEWVRSRIPVRSSSLQVVGGQNMTEHSWQRHPTAFAVVALAIVLPTLTFVLGSFLAYQLDVPGLYSALDPILRTMTGPRFIDLFLLAAPFVAFGLAVMPLLGWSASRVDGEPRLALQVRLRPVNLVVVVLAVLVGGFLVGHILIETVLEAGR